MQRVYPPNEAIYLIGSIRNDINAYLGRQRHYIDEDSENGYIYPSDLSGRLTKLQSITGNYSSLNGPNITLLDLLNEPAKFINEETLTYFTKELIELASPIPGFPPIKRELKKLMDTSIDRLLDTLIAIESVEFTQKMSDIPRIDAEFDMDNEPDENPEPSADDIAESTRKYEEYLATSLNSLFPKVFPSYEEAAKEAVNEAHPIREESPKSP